MAELKEKYDSQQTLKVSLCSICQESRVIVLYSVYFSFKSMIKDGGLDPPTTCKIAAQQLADIVGVVGGLRSLCSITSHQW
jgi:hypothetical protein